MHSICKTLQGSSMQLFNLTYCNGQFYLSTSLDPRVPRNLVKHYFRVHLWKCFWMKLALELVDSVKQFTLPNEGEGSNNKLSAWVKGKGRERKNLTLPVGLLELGPWFSLALSPAGSQSFSLRLNYPTCFPKSGLQRADHGPSQPS